MIRRTARSTRTDTLFPYTTLFRSGVGAARQVDDDGIVGAAQRLEQGVDGVGIVLHLGGEVLLRRHDRQVLGELGRSAGDEKARSEERRVGKESVSTCRYRWSPSN